MSKYMVGYCSKCGKRTKHKKIECTESFVTRAFTAVITLGWGLLLDHDYECECTICGTINTITKG